MKIVYIGIKEIKADNIAQTGLIWKRGEVHDVTDEKKALKLLEHSLIWAKVDNKSPEEIAALLLPEFKAVPPEPRVSFIPDARDASPYWEPVVVVVPEDIHQRMQAKELLAVFMTAEDADAFDAWKKNRDAAVTNTAPRKTGPKPQEKETKAGLDSAKKVA